MTTPGDATAQLAGSRLEARYGLLRALVLASMGLLGAACGALFTLLQAWSGQLLSIPGLLSMISLLGGVVACWYAVRIRPFGRPTLVLDANGLTHALKGSVAWQDVVGISLRHTPERSNRHFILALGISDSSPSNPPGRRGSMEFSLTGLDQPPERIHATALALRDRVEPPRLKSWFPGILPAHQQMLEWQERTLERLDRTEQLPIDGAEGRQNRQELQAVAEEAEQHLEAIKPALLQELAEQRRRIRWTVIVSVLILALALAGSIAPLLGR